MDYNKPLPNVDGDTQEFWAGCKEHELRFQKCKDCGHIRWPASMICPMCYSRDTQWIIASGKGKVVRHNAICNRITVRLEGGMEVETTVNQLIKD